MYLYVVYHYLFCIFKSGRSAYLRLFDVSSIYKECEYPKEFLKVAHLEFLDFDFWYLMDYDQTEWRIKGLQERYPERKLVPFARRGDNDDIVCFDIEKDVKVQKNHDFASAGWEQRREYNSFWDWFREAIDEMIEEGEYDEL